MNRPLRRLLLAAAFPAVPLVLFLLADTLFPLPLPEPGFGRMVLDRDGQPLRAFADADGVWRWPVTPQAVSPRYLEALLTYEDRWFRHHPGINPVALLRAARQWATAGEVVSGGSTLTMQVARLLDPHGRSVGGKLKQMFRALQLEWHYDKDAILALYLDRAPFGGPVEGVQAAAYAYLGKPAAELSHAEAALLAVLPQAPTRLRPDLHPERARRARDKVLTRLQRFAVWSPETVAAARAEPLPRALRPPPTAAPLLARRVKDTVAAGTARRTTVDGHLQRTLEARLATLAGQLPEHTSAAILVLENADLAVRAYLGSADFGDAARFGHVDMVQALRSPGSTLKPFLYGFALEAGLIHSQSLLVDAPRRFGDYRPGNFSGGYRGPVGVAEALRRSLNIPAVQVLAALGPRTFSARLAAGGLHLALPADAEPNLALVLGGAGTTLEQLTAAYAALARGGRSGAARLFPEQPVRERYLLDPGAAWIIADILARQARPGLRGDALAADGIAWKTGTSYGYRDAWAIGTGHRYTVGVWVGRPDGTPVPGSYGAITAAPILFALFDLLGDRGPGGPPPGNVRRASVCWPLGTLDDGSAACQRRRSAWLLNDTAPPTLAADEGQRPQRIAYRVDPVSGLRRPPGCAGGETREAVTWPLRLHPWLGPAERTAATLPAPDPACTATLAEAGSLRIDGITDGSVLRPAGAAGEPPRVDLTALGAVGMVYWLIDGRMAFAGGERQVFSYRFTAPGRYRISAVDERGAGDAVTVEVHLTSPSRCCTPSSPP